MARFAAAVACFAATGAGHAAGPREALGDYARCAYDRELAAYCGLFDDLVAEGAEVACTAAAAGLDDTARSAQRKSGGIAFEREWTNRNMGGRRGWCLTEGRAAVLGFVAAAVDARFAPPSGLARPKAGSSGPESPTDGLGKAP